MITPAKERFASDNGRPHGSGWHFLFVALLIGLLMFAIVASLAVGAVAIPVMQVVDILFRPVASGSDAMAVTIIWDIRFGRALLAALIGASLAAAGAALQGLFRNPLADPFVVGASSGAALGATVAIIAGLQWGVRGFGPVPLAAFVGAMLAVALVYGVAEMGGMTSSIALLLAGAALSTFLGAIVYLLIMLHDQNLYAIFGWLLGGLSGRSWPHLKASMPYMIIGIGMLWFLARPLDALAFGDETAQSLGLPLRWTRGAIIAAASLSTAAAVSAGGSIGFVGLIAPHAARLLVGAGHARLIPASALLGALLLLISDDLARTVMAPVELPVGIVTAMLGGPFFLYLLKTRQRELGAR
ncbi:MAG: iron ABC transporter permease [bacterium]|nr:iron ABC transporter permease [bacterium]